IRDALHCGRDGRAIRAPFPRADQRAPHRSAFDRALRGRTRGSAVKPPNERGHATPRGGRRASRQPEAEAVLKAGSAFYVLASSLSSRRTTRVLADGHSFAIFDAGGDIVDSPLEALGLFHRDTRYLSRFELRVAGAVPYFLNSFLSDDKAQLRVNLTNADLGVNGERIVL